MLPIFLSLKLLLIVYFTCLLIRAKDRIGVSSILLVSSIEIEMQFLSQLGVLSEENDKPFSYIFLQPDNAAEVRNSILCLRLADVAKGFGNPLIKSFIC